MAFRRWRERETIRNYVLAGELEGNYVVGVARGSGAGSKLADFCNTASVSPRQYVLVRGLSEGWCRRSEAPPFRLGDKLGRAIAHRFVTGVLHRHLCAPDPVSPSRDGGYSSCLRPC